MKITILTPEEAILQGHQLPFAYVTELSRVTVGRTPVAVKPEELLEARFFGPDKEIHIDQSGDIPSAICLTEEAEDIWIDNIRTIRCDEFGHTLTVREYISYDEDGQAYLSHLRLLDWKEETP